MIDATLWVVTLQEVFRNVCVISETTPTQARKLFWYKPSTRTLYIYNVQTSQWEEVSSSGTTSGITVTQHTQSGEASDGYNLVDATSGAITITLPLISSQPRMVFVKKIDNTSNVVYVVPMATNTIEGLGTYTLETPHQFVSLLGYNSVWYIVGR